MEQRQRNLETHTHLAHPHNLFSSFHPPSPMPHLPFSILPTVCLIALLGVAVGCGTFRTEPTPTASIPSSPRPQPTATIILTIILPTPPPGATLTAMVHAYRLTRTPGAVQPPTRTPISAGTPTASATAVDGPSVYVLPEVAEPESPVEIRGENWQPGETITLRLGTSVENAQPTGVRSTVSADGTFATTLRVPAPWRGDSAIVVAESLDGQHRAVTRLYLASPTATSPPPPTATATTPPTPTPVPTASPTRTFRRWRGEYYANPNLQGDPVLLRDDNMIDFDWHDGAPATGVPIDRFSVRWTREVDFLTGGYRFSVEVDDGVRVFIDDQLVLNEWKITSTTTYEFKQVLSGPTEMRVEYYDAGGNATLRLRWQYLGRYPNWRGAYYDNRTLSGTPAVVRDDIAVKFKWADDGPAPQIPDDNFSARWTRTVSFDTGTHRFHAQADDGVRVWVDDRLVIDEWQTSTGEAGYSADVYLSGGNHDIRVEYYEAGGKAEVYVWWENLDAYSHWRGAYYANRQLSGQPAFVQNDVNIDFDWGGDGPDDVGADDFSIRWSDRWNLFEYGVYRFFARHDDGVRLWVDDALVLDEWYATGPVTHQADVALEVGTHELRVDYFEAGGDASIRVWWEVKPIR